MKKGSRLGPGGGVQLSRLSFKNIHFLKRMPYLARIFYKKETQLSDRQQIKKLQYWENIT